MKKSFLLALILLLIIQVSVVGPIISMAKNHQKVNLTSTRGDQLEVLNILTRHPLEIANEFKEGFLKSSYAKTVGLGPEDHDRITFLQQSSTRDWINVMKDQESAIDIAWGGGPTLFNELKDADVLSPISSNITNFIEDDLNISTTFGGISIYDSLDQPKWISNVFSSFGFTVNNDLVEKNHLMKPTSWEDLSSPDFFVHGLSTVGLGNAPDSTSITRIYEIILQAFGWNKGWKIILSMAGNGDVIGGSSATRDSVIDNEVVAAMTIDFYGLLAQSRNPSTEYILPEGESYVSGDPIAMGKYGKATNIAEAFFKYTFSDEGQAIWVINNVVPINIDAFNTDIAFNRTDIKDLYIRTANYNSIEFDEALALSRDLTLKAYFEAVATLPHSELKQAWSSLVSQLRNSEISRDEFEGLISVMFEPQVTQKEANAINDQLGNDEAFKNETMSGWTQTSINRYNAFIKSSSQTTNRFLSLSLLPWISPFLMVIYIKKFRRNSIFYLKSI